MIVLYISYCSFILAIVKAQIPSYPPPQDSLSCPGYQQCQQRSQADYNTCVDCVQYDSTSGAISWPSSVQKCFEMETKFRNLKNFLACDSTRQVQQRILAIQNCELEKKISKCIGGPFGSQIYLVGRSCTDIFRKKRSSRKKRQTIDTSTNVYAEACGYAIQYKFYKHCANETALCSTGATNCINMYKTEQDQVDRQYKAVKQTFDSCVKLFDPKYDW